MSEVEIEQGVVDGLNTLTKEELLAASDQFGVDDVKRSMNKAELVQRLAGDGVTLSLVQGLTGAQDDEEEPEDDEPVEENSPAAEEDEEENLVLVRMIRANNTYQIRGYTFKLDHPFALVKEGDADYLIENDGGFRMASPKEAREFYK